MNAVREDPVRTGLLFAGTEQAVYVSFDDGDHWQSLRLNMPATSIRDLVVKDDDLVVGTHGRSFWILDDITPLRQLDARPPGTSALLFRAAGGLALPLEHEHRHAAAARRAGRARTRRTARSSTTCLKTAARGPGHARDPRRAPGTLVRRYRSDDAPEPPGRGPQHPRLLDPPAAGAVQRSAGLHRFVWDLHYAPPAAPAFGYPIAAICADTPREPRGPVGAARARTRCG